MSDDMDAPRLAEKFLTSRWRDVCNVSVVLREAEDPVERENSMSRFEIETSSIYKNGDNEDIKWSLFV